MPFLPATAPSETLCFISDTQFWSSKRVVTPSEMKVTSTWYRGELLERRRLLWKNVRRFESLQEVVERMGKQRVRIFFPLKEARLNLVQTNLERLKSDLQCMMQIIIYARLKTKG